MTDNKTDYKFQGWMGLDENSIGNLVHREYEPKKWEETDVDIKITHCGICASDLHTLRSGWFPTPYPIVVGHEIVGIAVRVGSEVKNVKVGDRVGVGAQSGSCLNCTRCKHDLESYCDDGQIGTYAGEYSPDIGRSQGGYSDYARVPNHFVIHIPENLDSEIAAPMMCGGVTVYSPLKKNGAGTTAKDVGIVGIGGLGHFGLMFAKALGANVTAISHSPSKKKDAEEMGATNFIATKEEGWGKRNRRTLDLIVATTNDDKMPLKEYLQLLRPGGKFIIVGVPEEALPEIQAFDLIMNNVFIGGSAIGAPAEIEEMLKLAADKGVKTWVERYPLDQVNDALKKFEKEGMRYRAVLFNEKNIKDLKQ